MYSDLRDFMEDIDRRGELRKLAGADWNLEIGALTEYASRRSGAPAILFDEIPGYQKGHRILVNALGSSSRVAPVLGMPSTFNGIEIVELYFACAKIGAVAVPINLRLSGPEIAYVLGHADSRLLVVHAGILDRFQEMRFPGQMLVVGGDDAAILALRWQR